MPPPLPGQSTRPIEIDHLNCAPPTHYGEHLLDRLSGDHRKPPPPPLQKALSIAAGQIFKSGLISNPWPPFERSNACAQLIAAEKPSQGSAGRDANDGSSEIRGGAHWIDRWSTLRQGAPGPRLFWPCRRGHYLEIFSVARRRRRRR